jgi:hypothetical protein
VLQEQEFERLGSTRTRKVDVRLVAATNRNLAQMIIDKQFREDLYFRLNVFPIVTPALRDRVEDIPLLVCARADRAPLRPSSVVWDKGTYEPQADIPSDKQVARGKIDVVLHGEKLCGGFTLIQTGRRLAGPSERKRWLLVKHRDEFADPSWDIDSPELDRSVLTGRTLNEIAESRPKTAPTRIARQQAAVKIDSSRRLKILVAGCSKRSQRRGARLS